MSATGTMAIVPKARSMYAKRISAAEYEEMMRRRTVPEVAALLRKHPYFNNNLASLSPTDPHRGQIEDLLGMDIFSKYKALCRYDFRQEGFTSYYLLECELREVLKMLHLIGIGNPEAYAGQIPFYLDGETRINLAEMAGARTFADLVEILRRTPYYKPLNHRLAADPGLRYFPFTEALLLRQYYAFIFDMIEEDFSGPEGASVRELFLQEVEIYNLELLFRVKTYFPTLYTPEQIRELLLPYTFRVTKDRLMKMVEAPTPEALLSLFSVLPPTFATVLDDPNAMSTVGGKVLYARARQILHLSPSPYASLASLLTLAKLERDNIINLVEGVRYNVPPEKIKAMLRY